MRKIRIDVDQSRPLSLAIAALLVPATVLPPFSNRRLTREFRAASPNFRSIVLQLKNAWSLPEHGNSRSERLNCGDVSYRVVVCQPTRRVLVPTASMPDVSTRVWQSIQIVTTLLVGFFSGPLYWTCHLSFSSVGVWPSSLCG